MLLQFDAVGCATSQAHQYPISASACIAALCLTVATTCTSDGAPRVQLAHVDLDRRTCRNILTGGHWPEDALRQFHEYAVSRAVSDIIHDGLKCYGIFALPSKLAVYQDIASEPIIHKWRLPSCNTPLGAALDQDVGDWPARVVEIARTALDVEVLRMEVIIALEDAEFGAHTPS